MHVEDDVLDVIISLSPTTTVRAAPLGRPAPTLAPKLAAVLPPSHHPRMETCPRCPACRRHPRCAAPDPTALRAVSDATRVGAAGDKTISYAEFARVLTTDDVLNMKNTLRAAG